MHLYGKQMRIGVSSYRNMEVIPMKTLNAFVKLVEGEFDNKEQFEEKQRQKDMDFPYATHRNTIINDRIQGLPADFQGIFLLEESYYTSNGRTHASPHLFLFEEVEEGIQLISYEMPHGYDASTLTAENLTTLDYPLLNRSSKFTPAVYKKHKETWEGGSVSMFTPTLKFTLHEVFSNDRLEVYETMEMNGKRTFGFDDPIIYKRK